MISKNVRDNAKDNQHHLNTLVNSNEKTINVIIKHNDPFAAVYAISNPNDGAIIYVGQTSDIVNRMNSHLSGASTFSKKVKVPENELKWYKIRHRRMANEKQRKFFESYVIGVLKPKFNF